jgi:hypothetical protein
MTGMQLLLSIWVSSSQGSVTFYCSVMARTIENKKLGAATMSDIVSTQLFSNEPGGLRS